MEHMRGLDRRFGLDLDDSGLALKAAGPAPLVTLSRGPSRSRRNAAPVSCLAPGAGYPRVQSVKPTFLPERAGSWVPKPAP
jgi:hypothetical protein